VGEGANLKRTGVDWEPPAREAAEEVRHLRGELRVDTSFCKAEESHIEATVNA